MNQQISRRQALQGAAAVGLMAAAPGSFAAAAWDRPIDIHIHVEPRTNDYAPFGTLEQMVNQHYDELLKYMDRNGIVQIVPSAGYRYRRTEGIVNTRAMNDMIAGLVAKNTARFPVGIGVAEVQHGEATLRELERMAKNLKLRGVGWHHADDGVVIDHPFMRPILRQVEALKMIPFIHVREKEYEAWWRLEVLAEEFPDLTFVAMSGLATTDDRTHAAVVGRRHKNILVDTGPALYGGEHALVDLVAAIGADRVLYGSDDNTTLTLQVIRNSPLSDHDKQLVLSGNAARLFGLKA
jgi:predicted TIM-barrel fold metal-dependent hydrolase